jgi:hypothetical protein
VVCYRNGCFTMKMGSFTRKMGFLLRKWDENGGFTNKNGGFNYYIYLPNQTLKFWRILHIIKFHEF